VRTPTKALRQPKTSFKQSIYALEMTLFSKICGKELEKITALHQTSAQQQQRLRSGLEIFTVALRITLWASKAI